MDKWYHSSNGSGNLSLTIKGAILAVVPLTVMALSSHGYNVDEESLVGIIESVFTVISSAMVTIGLIRKFYYKLIED